MSREKNILQNYPKYLWFLVISYSMILAISNWYDARLVYIFGVTLTPGTFFIPITFLLSDIITDVYGFKHAIRAIWVALFFNILFISYGKILTMLPSPSFPNNNDAIDKLISMDFWIIVASFVSYSICEPLNAYLVAYFKLKTNGKYLGLRFISSTVIATTIDTPLFVIIAFHKTLSLDKMIPMIFSIWLIKCLVEIGLLPFSIRLAVFLKKKEKLDTYDINTNFNPFTVNVDYSVNNNNYER